MGALAMTGGFNHVVRSWPLASFSGVFQPHSWDGIKPVEISSLQYEMPCRTWRSFRSIQGGDHSGGISWSSWLGICFCFRFVTAHVWWWSPELGIWWNQVVPPSCMEDLRRVGWLGRENWRWFWSFPNDNGKFPMEAIVFFLGGCLILLSWANPSFFFAMKITSTD